LLMLKVATLTKSLSAPVLWRGPLKALAWSGRNSYRDSMPLGARKPFFFCANPLVGSERRMTLAASLRLTRLGV